MPNGPRKVIVFLMDDQGYRDLGCQGAQDLKRSGAAVAGKSEAQLKGI